MATIGIMSYGMPPNLKLKKTFNKITITTNNGSSNVGILSDNSSNKLVINSPTIVKKIKDFGFSGSINNANSYSGVAIMRKKQKLVPLNESNRENNSQQSESAIPSEPQPPAKKFKIASKTVESKPSNQVKIESEPCGTPGRKGLPAPQAVARRNARERNRVKQVNNGFAALRQHIPEEIAKTFEAVGGNNRGSAKKLSKVETLRMAVEYIRGLEKLLGYEIPPVSPLSADDGFTVIKDEYGPMTPMNADNFENFDDSNGCDQEDDMSTSQIVDTLPNITTLNGLQYIRIPGTNTYQLLTADIFGNEENFNPLIEVNCFPNGDDLVDEEIPVSMLPAVAPASIPSGITQPTSTSPLPSTTSSSLLSPAAGGVLLQQTMSGSRGNNDNFLLPPLFQAGHDAPHHHHQHRDNHLARVKIEPLDIVYHLQEQQRQLLLGNSSPQLDGGNGQGYYITTSSSSENSSEEHGLYEGVVHLKKELNDVILDTSAAALSDESMMDAIDWWEANTPKSDVGTMI